MSQKKVKKEKKMKVIQPEDMPMRSVYGLEKKFMYQRGNASLQFTLNLADKKQMKHFIEVLEKSIKDVNAILELDPKPFITE